MLEKRREITDAERGRTYTAIDRVKGVILCDPVKIHNGLHGFKGPEIVLPTVEMVVRRQLIRHDKKRGK